MHQTTDSENLGKSLKGENLNFLMWEQILTGRTTFALAGNLKGIKFHIFPREAGHNEPHCHVEYQGHFISISLISYTVIAGNLPSKQVNQAVIWVKENIGVLKKFWNEYHEEIVA
jgi:hypothetical protein